MTNIIGRMSFTIEEVAARKGQAPTHEFWIAIHGKVYDITTFIDQHPGGAEFLVDNAGTDATAEFDAIGHSKGAIRYLDGLCIGVLSSAPHR